MSNSHTRVGQCAGVDRREFVKRASIIAAGVLAAMTDAGLARADGRWTVDETSPVDGLAGGARQRYVVPASDGALIDANAELLIVRWLGQVSAFALRCPHRGAKLEWRSGAAEVYCAKHKAHFRPDGVHASGRATRNLDRHPIRRVGDQLEVDLTVRLRADQDATAWRDAIVTLST